MTIRIRPYRDGDGPRINRSFNEVFGLARPFEEWRWKFPAEPEGRWIMLAVEERDEDGGERVLAQYATIPIRFQAGESTVRAGHVVDAFSLRRRGLAKKGVFPRTVERFFDDFGAPERLSLLFGFPGERHLKLGLAVLGYGEPRPVGFWRRGVALPAWPPRIWPRYRVRLGFDAAGLDDLWRRAAPRYPFATVRDAAWIGRRYRRRPEADYLHLAAYRGTEMGAYAVLRFVQRELFWAELLWDGQDERALEALDHEAVLAARRVRVERLTTWLAGDREAEAVLAHRGWQRQPQPDGLHLTVRSFDPRVDAAEVTRRFYMTMGDSDLV